MKTELSAADWRAVAAAMNLAAEQYQKDADLCIRDGVPHLQAQFLHQRDEAIAIGEYADAKAEGEA